MFFCLYEIAKEKNNEASCICNRAKLYLAINLLYRKLFYIVILLSEVGTAM